MGRQSLKVELSSFALVAGLLFSLAAGQCQRPDFFSAGSDPAPVLVPESPNVTTHSLRCKLEANKHSDAMQQNLQVRFRYFDADDTSKYFHRKDGVLVPRETINDYSSPACLAEVAESGCDEWDTSTSTAAITMSSLSLTPDTGPAGGDVKLEVSVPKDGVLLSSVMTSLTIGGEGALTKERTAESVLQVSSSDKEGEITLSYSADSPLNYFTPGDVVTLQDVKGFQGDASTKYRVASVQTSTTVVPPGDVGILANMENKVQYARSKQLNLKDSVHEAFVVENMTDNTFTSPRWYGLAEESEATLRAHSLRLRGCGIWVPENGDFAISTTLNNFDVSACSEFCKREMPLLPPWASAGQKCVCSVASPRQDVLSAADEEACDVTCLNTDADACGGDPSQRACLSSDASRLRLRTTALSPVETTGVTHEQCKSECLSSATCSYAVWQEDAAGGQGGQGTCSRFSSYDSSSTIAGSENDASKTFLCGKRDAIYVAESATFDAGAYSAH